MISKTARRYVAEVLAKYRGLWLENSEIAKAAHLSKQQVGYVLRGNKTVEHRVESYYVFGKHLQRVFYRADSTVDELLQSMMPRHIVELEPRVDVK